MAQPHPRLLPPLDDKTHRQAFESDSNLDPHHTCVSPSKNLFELLRQADLFILLRDLLQSDTGAGGDQRPIPVFAQPNAWTTEESHALKAYSLRKNVASYITVVVLHSLLNCSSLLCVVSRPSR